MCYVLLSCWPCCALLVEYFSSYSTRDLFVSKPMYPVRIYVQIKHFESWILTGILTKVIGGNYLWVVITTRSANHCTHSLSVAHAHSIQHRCVSRGACCSTVLYGLQLATHRRRPTSLSLRCDSVSYLGVNFTDEKVSCHR